MSQARQDGVKIVIRQLLGTDLGSRTVVRKKWQGRPQTPADLQKLEAILREQQDRPSPPEANQSTRRQYPQAED